MPNSEVLKVTSEYKPAGDQPQAIEEIVTVSYTHLTLPTITGV